MNSKEILLVVDAVSNEKDVGKEPIFQAIEYALAAATIKQSHEDIDVRVVINRVSGEYTAFRRWEVVSDETEIEFPSKQITLAEAQENDSELTVGSHLEKAMAAAPFGRIEAQTAKQVMVQKVREAERLRTVKQYEERIGQLMSGVVRRATRDNLVVDIGGVEALLRKTEMLPRESCRVGDRIRAYLYDVHSEPRGPQLFLSRVCPEMLTELFRIEVPEIEEGIIEIMGVSRDPGQRAKIAVRANDPRVDPIGACVGMRGSRVQAITNELDGERVDIVLWNDNPAQFVINAMSPAEVISIVVDEEKNSMDIAVSEDQLSQAIGRGGQNVKLASEVSGWTLNIMTKEDAEEKSTQESIKLREHFMKQLGVDEELANVLIAEGFQTLDEVAYVPVEEMLAIEGFDESTVELLRTNAKDSLLMQAIADEEKEHGASDDDLRAVEGMTDSLMALLVKNGIKTRDDLAEQAVDELTSISSEINDELAAQLIMSAREAWFEENNV